jgi:phosphate:Na+ symporter
MLGIIEILGGLALFMFGIHLLSSGMEKLAGDQIQRWLDRVTNRRLKSAAFGAAATALLQSSGLLMVTMISLINANLMTVIQSIGVMLGQEVGTTITAQIVAFDIGPLRLVLVILGIVFLEFFPNRDWKKYGEIFMGLGIVFVGMTYMALSLAELMKIPGVSTVLAQISAYPLLGLIAGLLLTALTQSSTAVTSMVVAMGISQVISLEGAIGMILGANIGSCITGFLASIRLSRSARQASMAQILINLIGVLLFLPFIPQFAELVSRTSSELPRQIANAHTIFNLAVSAILFPFVPQLAWLSGRLVPASVHAEKPRLTAYIEDVQHSVPAVALNEAAREMVRLGNVTAEMVANSCTALIDKDVSLAQRVITQEGQFVDPVYKEIIEFVNKLIRADLSIVQQKRCFQLKNLLTDVERVADMAEDIAQSALERIDNEVLFSTPAIDELQMLADHVCQTYRLALQAFEENDPALARQVCQQESEFDHLYWNVRQEHINRLAAGVCQPEADVIFTETLRSLERISDHADNFGVSVARTAKEKLAAVS